MGQALYNRRAWTRISRAEEHTHQTREQLQATREDVIKRVVETYFEALRQHAKYEVTYLERRVDKLKGFAGQPLALAMASYAATPSTTPS